MQKCLDKIISCVVFVVAKKEFFMERSHSRIDNIRAMLVQRFADMKKKFEKNSQKRNLNG